MSVDRRYIGLLQMPPPFDWGRFRMPSPAEQIEWGLDYVRSRYGQVAWGWRGYAWGGYRGGVAPLSREAQLVLERLRDRTGQWQTIGEVVRGLDGGSLVDAIEAIEAICARGIRLEFTRTPEHRKPGPLVANSWREAQGSALLRVRLP